MTTYQRPIMILLVCVGLALLATPGAAGLSDGYCILQDDVSPPSWADAFSNADAIPEHGTVFSLNQTDVLSSAPLARADRCSLAAGVSSGLEIAPLNPAFVWYQEEQARADSRSLCCVSAPDDPALPPLSGYIPPPATLVWSDDTVASATAAPTESYFNLADEGRVTPVKDQGDCGSCWTFAALGSLESSLLTDGMGAWDLSENNLKNTAGFDWGPCSGGNAFMAAAYLTRWSGPVNESDDPYILPVPSPESPTGLEPVLQVHNVTFFLPRDGPLDNDRIKTAIKEGGGLNAMFCVNRSCFDTTSTTYCLLENSTAKIDGNHAVVLVGWDDAYPAANFVETPPGDGAFIAKNSWGTRYGDDGYFYISYYDRSIGRFKATNETQYIAWEEATVLFTAEPVGTYDYLYQYDPLGYIGSVGCGPSTPVYGKNVFTADRYEDLCAVNFFTREPGTEYEITVSCPYGGMEYWVEPVHGTMALPGYHTIPLTVPFSLTPGQNVSVTLNLTAPTDPCPLAVEAPVEGYSSNATANPGESFVSEDGVQWTDLTDMLADTNLCIKAFTREPIRVPGDHATVQAAVDAALPGQMVFIEDGTYTENIVIDSPVALVGSRDAVIDGGAATTLTVAASNVTLRGFTLTGEDTGILVTGSDTADTAIIDLHLSGCGGDAIEVEDASRTFVINTEIRDGMDDGIQVDHASETTVSRSVLAGNGGAGVNARNADEVRVYESTLAGNSGDGVNVAGVDGVWFSGNTLAGNGGDGMQAVNSSFVVMFDVNASGNDESGFNVSNSGPFLIFDSPVADNNGMNGFDLFSIKDLILDNCTATDNAMVGIYLDDAKYSRLTRNTMAGNQVNFCLSPFGYPDETVSINETNTVDGKPVYVWNGRHDETVPADAGMVYLMGCQNITAEGLTLAGNHMGLCVYNSTDITVRDLLTTGNDLGAYFIDVDTLSVDASAMVTNTFGFVSENSTAVTLTGSRIADNLLGGLVTAGDPADNLLWRNTFANNTFGHLVAEGPVALNTTAPLTYQYNDTCFTHALGNYWDDYAGTDTNGDGVGETPYNVRDMFDNTSAVNDTCPLVAPADRYVPGFPDTDDGDDWGGIGAAGDLDAGATTTLTFEDSAVTDVTLTAATRIDGIMVTVAPAADGPDGLNGPVYQYLVANLTYVGDDAIAKAVFTVDVPTAWLKAQGLASDEVAFWRYHDGGWVALLTEIVSEESGRVVYRATSPGFSYFAVAAGETIDPTPTVQPTMPGDLNATSVNATTEKPTVSETPVPTATTAASTAAPTSPAQTPLPWWSALVAAGGAIVLALRHRR